MEYDSKGRVIATSDGTGNRTGFEYHEDLAKTELFAPDLGAIGRKTVTDARGNKTVHEYDAYGNVVFTRDALGNEQTESYTYENDRIRHPDV